MQRNVISRHGIRSLELCTTQPCETPLILRVAGGICTADRFFVLTQRLGEAEAPALRRFRIVEALAP